MTAQQTDPPIPPILGNNSTDNADAPLAEALVGGNDYYHHRETGRGGDSYSKFVKFMKIVLPLGSVLIIGLILGWPYISGIEGQFKIGFSSINLSSNEQTGVDNARYFGVDDLSRPYSISADLARFPEGPKGSITLEMPKADITVDDGSWLVMTAKTGIYNQKNKLLSLQGAVNLFHDSGYEISTDEIDINLAKNDAIGTKPINGHGPFGELNASGIRIDKNNNTIFFIGPARLLMFPSANNEVSIGG